MGGMPCFCGHDCACCITYLATLRNDDVLRLRAQAFYRETFLLDVPLEQIHCRGGRSDDVFFLCRECPFAICCRGRALSSCADCADYPCPSLREYQLKYVNRCLQVE